MTLTGIPINRRVWRLRRALATAENRARSCKGMLDAHGRRPPFTYAIGWAATERARLAHFNKHIARFEARMVAEIEKLGGVVALGGGV